jgi:hypothetical protein
MGCLTVRYIDVSDGFQQANRKEFYFQPFRRSYCELSADKPCHVVSVTDPYGRFSRPEPLLFLPSSSSFDLTRLRGPRSRPSTSQIICFIQSSQIMTSILLSLLLQFLCIRLYTHTNVLWEKDLPLSFRNFGLPWWRIVLVRCMNGSNTELILRRIFNAGNLESPVWISGRHMNTGSILYKESDSFPVMTQWPTSLHDDDAPSFPQCSYTEFSGSWTSWKCFLRCFVPITWALTIFCNECVKRGLLHKAGGFKFLLTCVVNSWKIVIKIYLDVLIYNK